jgi:hypothetical protein
MSSYYIGNTYYTITYFQKEYPANFLYPTIYYLFGKYCSKSNSKSLKTIALSSLTEVSRLLYEDLQYSVLYWLGIIYYNIGRHDECFKQWKLFYENADRAFDNSYNKLNRVKGFLDKYQTLGNSLQMFKRNLVIAKDDNYSHGDSSETMDTEKVKDFLYDLELIKDVKPNITYNFNLQYVYYKGLVHFYVESKHFDLTL